MADWYNPFSWGSDPYGDAQKYLGQYEQILNQAYDPYIEYGMRAMPTLEEQYALLLSNPAAVQAMLGQGFEESPGYEFQMDQAMNASNQAASAGGMLGTPSHTQQSMGVAQGLAAQDYWNYYNQNASLYNQGLTGTQGQFDTGFNATNQKQGAMGNLYGSKANLANAQGQSQQNMFSSLLGAGIGAAGYAFGGPAGGAATSGIYNLADPNAQAYWYGYGTR